MSDLFSILIIVYYIFLVITAIYLLLDNREPSSTIAWLILFILFPVMGFIVYIFFGRSWRRTRTKGQLVHQFIEGHLVDRLQPLIQRQEAQLKRLESKWTIAYKSLYTHLYYSSFVYCFSCSPPSLCSQVQKFLVDR